MDQQKTSLLTAVVIAAVVLGTIILYFFISIIRQQRRNLALQRANMLAEINAMERERARIANDLHDDLSPVLSVIKFQVISLKITEEKDRQQVQHAADHLDSMIHRLREISNNLMPNTLLRKGLVLSLEELLRAITESTPLKTKFLHQNVPELPTDKSIHIFRLIQEIIHNCIKHSGATELDLFLEGKEQHLMVRCSDNGAGFDYEQKLQQSEGFGLRSLKSRIELMKGTVKVVSGKDRGTVFFFQIPT